MFSRLFAITSVLAASAAWAKILYAGVNESGGEFSVWSNTKTVGTGLPGRFGTDYAFINKSTVDIFVDNDKANFFRVTFLMERMAPVATGLGSTFNDTYFGFYEDAINYITKTKGAYALIDPHNYMRYNDPSQQPTTGSIIGDTTDPKAATTAQFGEFWAELARRFVDNEKVVFGINNEPHDMLTSLVFENNQAAINGIRSVGAKQLILAPGNGYTGGHSFTQLTGAGNWAPSSDYMFKLHDPANNYAIDIHEYLDIDFSGGHADCAQPAPSNLAALTTWLKKHSLKAMITEFSGGDNQNCYNYIDELLTYMEQNKEYIGWTAWAAGPIWGDNSPCCGPDTGSLEPGQVNALGQPSAYSTVWATAIRPHIPTTLKWSGISTTK